jgi:hypothetical protein
MVDILVLAAIPPFRLAPRGVFMAPVHAWSNLQLSARAFPHYHSGKSLPVSRSNQPEERQPALAALGAQEPLPYSREAIDQSDCPVNSLDWCEIPQPR